MVSSDTKEIVILMYQVVKIIHSNSIIFTQFLRLSEYKTAIKLMPQLSVIIITKNAEAHIQACLDSVAFANEIIVVDANSTDKTATICQQFDKKVAFFVMDDWLGFGTQKNRALAKAQGEWILSIDADERVSNVLQGEIITTINNTTHTAFRLRRLSQFMGRWMKHSWSDDYVTRLFKRDSAKFTDDLVHERLQVFQGTIGIIDIPLWHYSFSSVEEVLEKMNHYSSASAQVRYQQRQQASLTQAILHGLWTFFRFYVLKRGFLDGQQGFMLAVSNAEGSYYRYLKLMYLQRREKIN
jgi:glycosyltransferase involved in cell wall biosynthesis